VTDRDRTLFFERHRDLGARIVEFGGWDMPLQYPSGTIAEHLAVRRRAGVFDVSHMGRFTVRGVQAMPFLQHVLTNNAEALDGRPHGAQYTLIPDERGGAVDDAYLYRFEPDEYLLVVNAANREKDWAHLRRFASEFDVEMIDETRELAMLAVQGPHARDILGGLLTGGHLPEPIRNSVSTAELAGAPSRIGRTGYTGEPVAFEVFVPAADGLKVWDAIADAGATPAGLGARDTLRLEVCYPLHGNDITVETDAISAGLGWTCALAKEFTGVAELRRIKEQGPARRLVAFVLSEKAVPRQGMPIEGGGEVTSGTHSPMLDVGIGMGYVPAPSAQPGTGLVIDVRGKARQAKVVEKPIYRREETW
jgi:aminomethyltransferase